MNCKNIKAAIDSASRRHPINGEAHAHLSGCPDCRSYSDQSNALLALLTAQPRVQAPADFNFRLSARIARAEAQPTSPFAFLENLFGQTFSIKQAAASLAALAVMAAGTTLYFNQSSQQNSDNQMIASNIAPVVQTIAVPELPPSVSAPTVNLAAKSQGRVTAMKPAVLVQASTLAVLDQASANDKVSIYDSEKGHVSKVSKGGVVYGAESSALQARSASFGSF